MSVSPSSGSEIEEAIVDDVRAMIEEEEQQWADLPVARQVSDPTASQTLPIGQAVEANAADEEAVPMAQVVEPTEPTSQGLPMGEAVKPMAASPAAAALTDPFGSLGSLALVCFALTVLLRRSWHRKHRLLSASVPLEGVWSGR